MSSQARVPSIGVEEEYQLVNSITGELHPTSQAVKRWYGHPANKSDIQHELHLEQIEMATPVLNSMEELRECLAVVRGGLSAAAEKTGSVLVSAGTHPLHSPPKEYITPSPRYQLMAERYKALAWELVIFGCHIHVDMPDRDLGVQVLDRLRPWLPLLQAISANSPFWKQEDTEYASFRRELWMRWPMAGAPHAFENYADYQQCVQDLVNAGAIEDETKIYWDVRLPARVPTIEFRIFDGLTDLEETVVMAAICRALVVRCELATHTGEPLPGVRPELLSSALWHAARYGMTANLIDCEAAKPTNAWDHWEQFVEFIGPQLRQLGDWQRVQCYAERLRREGTPAERQRRLLREYNGDMRLLVLELAKQTCGGTYHLNQAAT